MDVSLYTVVTHDTNSHSSGITLMTTETPYKIEYISHAYIIMDTLAEAAVMVQLRVVQTPVKCFCKMVGRRWRFRRHRTEA